MASDAQPTDLINRINHVLSDISHLLNIGANVPMIFIKFNLEAGKSKIKTSWKFCPGYFQLSEIVSFLGDALSHKIKHRHCS